MIFCEDCRLKKQWPRSPGFPFVGIEKSVKCEVCHKKTDCHTVPTVVLLPEAERTFDQKLVYKIMEEGFKDRADSLVVVHVSGAEAGKINHRMTELLRSIKIQKNGKTDWYSTYQLRLVAQQGYQKDEESKRNRR